MIPVGNYNAYAQVDLATTIAAATPIELVQMLYDGALKAIWAAQGHIMRKNISGKGESISKAIAIIEELNDSLNHDAGGDISRNLEALYDYMTGRLVRSNVDSDPAPLKEVEKLLSELSEAWEGIAKLPEEALNVQTAGSAG